jgi:effector-binding domain-containing protein
MVKLNQILAFKEAGFALSEISDIFSNKPAKEKLIALLEQKADMLEDAARIEQDRISRLRTNIFLIKNGGIPIMNEITVKKVEPILVASLRTTIPDFHEMMPLWKELNSYIDSMGGKKVVPCMTLYHNGWDAGSNWDIEVIEPVAKAFAGNGRVKVYELDKADKMACIVHNGPFETISQTYAAISKWIEENGYEIEGPVREIYHKGDWAAKDPSEYVTEIQFPLKDR